MFFHIYFDLLNCARACFSAQHTAAWLELTDVMSGCVEPVIDKRKRKRSSLPEYIPTEKVKGDCKHDPEEDQVISREEIFKEVKRLAASYKIEQQMQMICEIRDTNVQNGDDKHIPQCLIGNYKH